jgi:tRNA threonylcarbamoyladenosine biosynthesis protein TsaE
MKILSKSLEETEEAAKVFLEKLLPQKDKATIVALSGDLGSGKTTFVQAVARLLDVKGNITSPTFVLIKFYELTANSYKLLVHVDAYRLKSGEEIRKLGWGEIISEPKNLVFIEWPENIASAVPKDAIEINFKFIDESTREIEF